MLHSREREVTGMAQKFTVGTWVASPIQGTSDYQHGCIMVSTCQRLTGMMITSVTSDFVVVVFVNTEIQKQYPGRITNMRE